MIEALSAHTSVDITRIGGKGAGLVRLLHAGLDVPEAFVILASTSLSAGARAACLGGEIPDWWAEVSRQFPGARWAVRSSAVAEDLEGASFAGVYDTVLGVSSLEGLIEAVTNGWAALDRGRAEVYREERGITASGGIALVLQRMVEPRVSGVLLTANPMRSFADELAIDASWGLGEAIVSGRTDPDHLVVDRSTGVIREELIGTKQVEIIWDGGIVERPVDEARQIVRCLTDDDVKALVDLARRVGSRIGEQRDLEWAIEGTRLYALQDRPITGLPDQTPVNVWSRRWADEYLAEYVMPLSSDLLLRWIEVGYLGELAQLQGRRDLVGVQAVRRHNGYAYFSGEYVLRMMQAFPPKARRATLTGWYSPLWDDRVLAAPWRPRHLVGSLTAPVRDKNRGRQADNPPALDRHCATIDREVVPLLTQDYAGLTDVEWRRQYELVDALGLDHFRVIRWGMGHHGPLLHATLGRLLRSWCDDRDGELYQAMISGLPGTRTAEINRAVWDLALLALDDDELADGLRGALTHDEVRDLAPTASFWPRFDAFMSAYGHRSSSREISALRWHEQPDVIIGFVRAQLRCTPFPADPRETERQAQRRRAEAEQTAFARAGKGPLGKLRRAYLEKVCRRTQTFTVYRENQRFHLDYLSFHLRQLVLEQGRRFTARGLLSEAFEVFFLQGDELWALMSGRDVADLAARVDERRNHYLVHRDRLPATFLFDDVETEGEIAEGEPASGDAGHGFSGLGASRGQARGPARVVTGLADLADVEPGDVLVANNIDPGWTSVFPLLAGLVTETGGILSHGAILAREYGIPTVTGVKEAVANLPSGTLVDVDGSAGLVSIVDEAPEATAGLITVAEAAGG